MQTALTLNLQGKCEQRQEHSIFREIIMFVLGIDVSKEKLDCYLSQSIEDKPKQKMMFQVANNEGGFEKINLKLAKNKTSIEDITVILEPTSTYHVELIYWLHAHKAAICLANPKDTHHYAKSLGRDSKTDRLDCFALAQFGLTRKLYLWTPPSNNIRKLSALMRQRNSIIQDRVREEHRLDALPKDEKRWVGHFLQKEINLFRKQEAKINAKIKALIAKDEKLSAADKRLRTIPGIGRVIAPYLIVLLSNREFQTGQQAAAFCGIIPKEYQSGSSIKGQARMTKRGPSYIRAALKMGANSILTTKSQSSLKSIYERLLNSGKTKSCDLGAVMHKLVVIAFAMWRDKTDYCYLNKPCEADTTNPAQRPSKRGTCCI